MKKIVINAQYGGFGLSLEAISKFLTLKGINHDCNCRSLGIVSCVKPGSEVDEYGFAVNSEDDIDYLGLLKRDDSDLIKVVEELGESSWGRYAELKIVEIPDDVVWYVDEYDGKEWVAELHRTWA